MSHILTHLGKPMLTGAPAELNRNVERLVNDGNARREDFALRPQTFNLLHNGVIIMKDQTRDWCDNTINSMVNLGHRRDDFTILPFGGYDARS